MLEISGFFWLSTLRYREFSNHFKHFEIFFPVTISVNQILSPPYFWDDFSWGRGQPSPPPSGPLPKVPARIREVCIRWGGLQGEASTLQRNWYKDPDLSFVSPIYNQRWKESTSFQPISSGDFRSKYGGCLAALHTAQVKLISGLFLWVHQTEKYFIFFQKLTEVELRCGSRPVPRWTQLGSSPPAHRFPYPPFSPTPPPIAPKVRPKMGQKGRLWGWPFSKWKRSPTKSRQKESFWL